MGEKAGLWVEVDLLKKAVFKLNSVWRLEPLFRGIKQVRDEPIYSVFQTRARNYMPYIE